MGAPLGRVTRPGGRVALANWTRGGFVGTLFGLVGKYAKPPSDVPSPLLWGDEAVVRERLDPHFVAITTMPRLMTFHFAFGPRETARLFMTEYGPVIRALEMMSAESRDVFAAELENHWVTANRAGQGETLVESEYLEVLAARR